jgi:hypothetical protein
MNKRCAFPQSIWRCCSKLPLLPIPESQGASQALLSRKFAYSKGPVLICSKGRYIFADDVMSSESIITIYARLDDPKLDIGLMEA